MMLFNSHVFIFGFLPVVLIIYYSLSKIGSPYHSRTWLVVSSIFFYGYWNPKYVPLLLLSIVINYMVGRQLIKYRQKIVLAIGIVFNLILLGYYKYLDFFILSLNELFSTEIPLKNLLLPLAISFFTFQQISYLVDCLKGKVNNNNFINYLLFVTFFPQLIAGPIVHQREMMPQFEGSLSLKINYHHIALGVFIFSIGLFKKVILADNLSITVLDGLNFLSTITFFDAWTVIISYTLQIYFDFSGYSDMAVGLALLFNIKLPINFDSPYKATNFQQLISRWHITLMRFLQEYVYKSLNRYIFRKHLRVMGVKLSIGSKTYLNVLILLIISGIWHGAGWNFIAWGFLVGMGVVFYRVWSTFKIKLPVLLAWLLTFIYLNFTMVFFRLSDFDQALLIIKALFGLNGFILPEQLAPYLSSFTPVGLHFEATPLKDKVRALAFLIVGLILVTGFKNTAEKANSFKPTLITAIFIIIIFIISIMNLTNVSEFLYFNF
ncbi:MBOAT family O-acyltransferase [Paenibacillus sp. strain BS8-2]